MLQQMIVLRPLLAEMRQASPPDQHASSGMTHVTLLCCSWTFVSILALRP
jgi:hypothetical protein